MIHYCTQLSQHIIFWHNHQESGLWIFFFAAERRVGVIKNRDDEELFIAAFPNQISVQQSDATLVSFTAKVYVVTGMKIIVWKILSKLRRDVERNIRLRTIRFNIDSTHVGPC